MKKTTEIRDNLSLIITTAVVHSGIVIIATEGYNNYYLSLSTMGIDPTTKDVLASHSYILQESEKIVDSLFRRVNCDHTIRVITELFDREVEGLEKAVEVFSLLS